jgi:hypothetical protein
MDANQKKAEADKEEMLARMKEDMVWERMAIFSVENVVAWCYLG